METEETAVTQPEPPKGLDLYDFPTMEVLIAGMARKLAREWRYRDDIFTVHLVAKLRGGYDLSILPGNPIRIELLWPYVLENGLVQTKLRSAFQTIKKMGLYQPFAVATHAYFQAERENGRKWVRQKLGSDMADTLASLIPKHRLRTIITTQTQVVDTITGTTVETTVSTQSDHRDAPFAMWSQISQIVFMKHPETVDFVEEVYAPTPQQITEEIDP